MDGHTPGLEFAARVMQDSEYDAFDDWDFVNEDCPAQPPRPTAADESSDNCMNFDAYFYESDN